MKKKLIIVLCAALLATNVMPAAAADAESNIGTPKSVKTEELQGETEIPKDAVGIVEDETTKPEIEVPDAETSGTKNPVTEAKPEIETEENAINKQSATTQPPEPVTDLAAVSSGRNIRLVWNGSVGAEGYIIYRQIGGGKFQYLYMVSFVDYLDTTASADEYNFYRVYPYVTNASGKRILGASTTYIYAKPSLDAVTDLSAKGTGDKQVTVNWSNVKDAEGYIIYRQVGSGKMSYRYMVSGTSFVDTTASNGEYNFYRIYPYFTSSLGKRIIGSSTSYTFAKGRSIQVTKAVTNLNAASVAGGVKLTWGPSVGADGYLIYGQVAGGSYGFVGMTTKGTTYTDRNASQMVYNFYWIFPYHYGKDGKRIVGEKSNYVYGRARLERDEKQDNTLAALALIVLDKEAQYYRGSSPMIESIYLDTNGRYQVKYKSDLLTYYATCELRSAQGPLVYPRIYYKDIPNGQVIQVCTWMYGYVPEFSVLKELPKSEIMLRKAQLMKEGGYTLESRNWY